MKIKGLKVFILTEADAADPTNQLVIAAAKALVTGPHGENACAWKGTAIQLQHTQQETIELAVAHLIKQILTQPDNPVIVGQVPTPPDIEFEVSTVFTRDYEPDPEQW